MITYADDTVLIYSCIDINMLKSQIESDMITVGKWFSFNDLALNLNKTKFIHFNLIHLNSVLNIKFHSVSCNGLFTACNCHLLQQVDSIKYLGLFIDSNLKWKTHINELCKKLRFVLIKFRILKNRIHKSFLITLYHSWFNSLLNYGIIVWGGEYKSNLFPLISIQNKFIKLLNPLSTQPSNFKSLNILPVRHYAFFRIILFLYNNKNLCDLKTNISSRRPTILYNIPRFHKEIFRKHFFYLAPKLFNCLPVEFLSVHSPNLFKRYLFDLIISIDNLEAFFHLYHEA